MWEDPIVAEVRRVREELAARDNYDVAKMFAEMQRRQESYGDRLVRMRRTRQVEPASAAGENGAGSSPIADSVSIRSAG
jgi:hypothetical protein